MSERDWMASDLEAAADRANAEGAPVDWGAVGAAARSAREEAAKGKLDLARIDELLRDLAPRVPPSRGDVIEELRAELVQLLNRPERSTSRSG